jgi:micrococcal nuclease
VVERVSDGDSFHCRDRRRVRLIGIDSPELGQGEPGRQAQAALRRLLPKGTTIRLERDVSPRDRYGRELAYVWTGSRMVNEVLVREGWAMLYTLPPNVKYAERLEQAQKQARARGAGLWGSGGFGCAPMEWRKRECGQSGAAGSAAPLPRFGHSFARFTSSRSVMLSSVSRPTSRPPVSTTGSAGKPLDRRRSSAS